MDLNLQEPFFLNVLKKIFDEIFMGWIMLKSNIMPTFNIDLTILLKLFSFL